MLRQAKGTVTVNSMSGSLVEHGQELVFNMTVIGLFHAKKLCQWTKLRLSELNDVEPVEEDDMPYRLSHIKSPFYS